MSEKVKIEKYKVPATSEFLRLYIMHKLEDQEKTEYCKCGKITLPIYKVIEIINKLPEHFKFLKFEWKSFQKEFQDSSWSFRKYKNFKGVATEQIDTDTAFGVDRYEFFSNGINSELNANKHIILEGDLQFTMQVLFTYLLEEVKDARRAIAVFRAYFVASNNTQLDRIKGYYTYNDFMDLFDRIENRRPKLPKQFGGAVSDDYGDEGTSQYVLRYLLGICDYANADYSIIEDLEKHKLDTHYIYVLCDDLFMFLTDEEEFFFNETKKWYDRLPDMFSLDNGVIFNKHYDVDVTNNIITLNELKTKRMSFLTLYLLLNSYKYLFYNLPMKMHIRIVQDKGFMLPFSTALYCNFNAINNDMHKANGDSITSIKYLEHLYATGNISSLESSISTYFDSCEDVKQVLDDALQVYPDARKSGIDITVQQLIKAIEEDLSIGDLDEKIQGYYQKFIEAISYEIKINSNTKSLDSGLKTLNKSNALN